MDFLGKYPSVKKFEMPVHHRQGSIGHEQILKLAAKLPNLEEVALRLDSSVTHEDVLSLVRSCEKLRQLHLLYYDEAFSTNFGTEIDELFDVDVQWIEAIQEGLISIRHKYNR